MNISKAESGKAGSVVCVDLDGSLLATDLLWETFARLLASRPWEIFLVFGWLTRGKANLKWQLARRTVIDPSLLPYHQDVVDYLKQRHAAGDRLILTTAADASLAQPIADYLGLFEEVHASDGTVNLKGRAKLDRIEARFGKANYAYVGNGPEDLPIWKSAREAIVVEPGPRLIRQVRALGIPVKIFERPGGTLSSWTRLVRVHQWAKNLLLFVPLMTSHLITNPSLLLLCLIAFLSFSFGASSIYLVNDLVDLPTDRTHPRKRRRPMASGVISIPAGMTASLLLIITSISLAVSISSLFLVDLLIYLITSLLYTFFLKRKMLVDVFCLAGLYTLRMLAGGAAIDIEISTWLMAFSMFLFLSLAFLKRYIEISERGGQGNSWLPGRGYQALDLDMIRSVGPASGYISVLVICLYLNDPQSMLLYRHPRWLWMLCPVMLYWITRVWLLAQRQQMHFDPVVFALRDAKSLAVGFIVVVIICAATLL